MIIIRNNKIRKKLKAAFKRSGLTQSELAHKSGVPQHRISQYLADKRGMSSDNVKCLCGVLGLHLILKIDVANK
ncbi:hypothetical protein LCGC14_0392530 [marine sediment metagenome]|uniref:HTH cro/C1-type domain-containing protein n=1 Tax=marine sediment metagenome TaxID=412755 RepID=A0A0F9T580_9ZZZZ